MSKSKGMPSSKLSQLFIAAKKETYSRFMQHKNETNVDILDQVRKNIGGTDLSKDF